MKFKDFLDHILFDSAKFTITISDVLILVLILFVTKTIIELLKRIFKRQVSKKGLDIGKSHAVLQLVKYILWIAAIILCLDTLGINLTILLAGSAALLVGLGLGLQHVFQDFISGIILLFEGTIKVGDIVEIQDQTVGRVKEIGLRTSKIETRNNIIMIIPNSKFIADSVINWSHIEKRSRFSVSVGVAYGSDAELVRKVLIDCALQHKEVSKNPQPFVKFEDFGESSLNFELYFWTSNNFGVEIVKSDLRFLINKMFKENGVQIPFPQRDIHIKK
ncbi:MAG: mechanosensitive ion channel [Bacteroidales bacterium]|nr:MAG: mechanosensitive ion channel [Bacteroidales bacterium]